MTRNQHPAIAPLRNAMQAFIGERDNAGLPVSELIVSDFTKHDVAILQRNEHARPFAWICGWAGTYLVWAKGQARENVYTRYTAAELVGFAHTSFENTREPNVALRVAMFFWNGRTLVRCETLDELQAYLRA